MEGWKLWGGLEDSYDDEARPVIFSITTGHMMQFFFL